ncbi:T9SS type A sorting domain-containing protein [Flavobacteriales bacterium]|nr:T9SS type A sorting domain-containing protein [Flavobacteriales bacterium]
MKKLFYYCSFLALPAMAQQMPSDAFEVLETNTIRAHINTDGTLFYNRTAVGQGFEIPINEGKHSIYSSGLWIQGNDSSSQAYVSVATYGSEDTDYAPGPVTNQFMAGDTIWNRLWKISKYQVDDHIMQWNQSNYTIPEVILNWPAHGDINRGQASNLAPFEDLNGNGTYEPLLGEYPSIQGDHSVFFMFNDATNVSYASGGDSLRIEVHGLAYGYDCSMDISFGNIIFVDYKIHNRSGLSYTNTKIGVFSDFDIGGYDDDYVACDVGRSAYYVYNGDNDDQNSSGSTGYGLNPPAQACVFLSGPTQDADGLDNAFGIGTGESINGYGFNDWIIDNEKLGMNRFIYFNHAGPSCCTHPQTDIEFNNYMNSKWRDGSPITYGGVGYGDSLATKFMFPGDSDPLNWGTNGADPNYPLTGGWTEENENNLVGDRRGLGTTGPFTFLQGDVKELTLAYVFADSDTGDQHSSVALMKQYIDDIMAMRNANGYVDCSSINSIKDVDPQKELTIYPNPTSNFLYVESLPQGSHTYYIYDIYGKLILTDNLSRSTINTTNLSQGVYLLKIGNQTRRFIKN